MTSYRRRLTPGDVSAVFSLAVGVVSAMLIYQHRVGQLIAAQAAWFGFLAFLHFRAKGNGGIFLNADVRGHYGLAIGGYLLGLLVASFAYVLPYE